MTNAQHYRPNFCKALDRPDLEKDPKFATYDDRMKNAGELVTIIEEFFVGRTFAQLKEILSANNLIWSPASTPLEITQDPQAIDNEFFVDWDHPRYGKIKIHNNPIKLSETVAEQRSAAPELGEHMEEIMKGLGYPEEDIKKLAAGGAVG